MGASGWSYLTSYQENVAQALRMLRQSVFQAGRYQKFWLYHEVPEEAFEALDEIALDISDQQMLEELARVLEREQMSVALPPVPQTIEDVLHRNGAEGTHTILDIEKVAEQPGYRLATPLSQTELCAVFGTEQPTHEMVETALAEHKGLEHMRGRWEAIYFTVYRDGAPDELCFCGHSGD